MMVVCVVDIEEYCKKIYPATCIPNFIFQLKKYKIGGVYNIEHIINNIYIIGGHSIDKKFFVDLESYRNEKIDRLFDEDDR